MNNMRQLPILVTACVLLLLQSCAVTKKQAFPQMYEKPPLTILVLPPVNQSTAVDAKEFYQTTITEPLSLTGYYAYPIEVISDILKNEGIYETVDLSAVDPGKFKKFFGADAVLHITIQRWNKVYFVIGGYVEVSIDMKLVSTETGDVIWQYNGTLKVDTSSGGSNIIANAIITAVKTGLTDYVPIAKKANIQALTAIPYGKYHSRHLKDGKMRAVNSRTVDKVDNRTNNQ